MHICVRDSVSIVMTLYCYVPGTSSPRFYTYCLVARIAFVRADDEDLQEPGGPRGARRSQGSEVHPGHDHSYMSLQQLTHMNIAAILPTACGGPALFSPWASLFASRQTSAF